MTAALVMMTSGCATAFVRSKDTVETHHVFPATRFDGEFFWESGVKGEPLFVEVDGEKRNNPVARCAYMLGAIIDMPFSIAFDTLLLPVDLARGELSKEESEPATLSAN
jgi:uncharacterized protein YceK